MRSHSRPMLQPCILRAGLAAALLLLASAPALAADTLVGTVNAGALQAALGLAPGVGATTLQTLELPATARPGASLHVRLQLDGAERDVVLLPHSLRAPDFRLLVQGADGAITAQTPEAPVTFRGHVVGLPESIVAASLIDGQLHAVLRLAPTQSLWGVQPASQADPQAARALHVVYDSADSRVPAANCGTTEIPPPPPAGSPGDAGPGDKVCEIACDADFEYYGKNGSNVTTTMNDIENVLNVVESIYEADVGILYEITTILVRTAEPDPYTSTNANTLLTQFTQHWNTSQGGVHRDIAHLFTGKNISGSTIGIAQLSVICSVAQGYGLVQSKYSSNLALRAALSAHELGHNWSAGHCDGDSACSIMCSGLGGCSGNISSFNTSSKNAITSKKNSSGCLADAVPPPPPVLSTVAPAAVQSLLGGTVTLTGSGFLKANDVLVGGVSLLPTGGFQVQNDTQLSFGAPPAPALGPVDVVVSSPGGSSSAKTLSFVETDPPKLLAHPIAIAGTLYAWNWGAGVGDPAFLLLAFSPATYTYQGQPILATNLMLTMAPGNAAGLGALMLQLPASAGGLAFYSEIVTLDGPTVRASNITNTILVVP